MPPKLPPHLVITLAIIGYNARSFSIDKADIGFYLIYCNFSWLAGSDKIYAISGSFINSYNYYYIPNKLNPP